MTTLADQLPPEIARQIHPDRLTNEAGYWAARDRLLEEFRGQWVGFADGNVIASGASPVAVLHAAETSGLHPFVICVGREQEPSRIRRTNFAYDIAYPGEALPQLVVEFRPLHGVSSKFLDCVIPDTGADATVLPWADCQAIGLTPNQGIQSLMSGVAGGSTATLAFLIWAIIDGQQLPCRLQADLAGTERILGRDVLNRLRVLFDGPAAEVVVNP